MHPSPNRETRRPVLPNVVYSIGFFLSFHPVRDDSFPYHNPWGAHGQSFFIMAAEKVGRDVPTGGGGGVYKNQIKTGAVFQRWLLFSEKHPAVQYL
jgi:hypothetical protein